MLPVAAAIGVMLVGDAIGQRPRVAAHRRLVDEVSGLHAQVDAALAALDGIAPPPAPSGPPPRNGGKRFEMWITLRVGLPEAIEAEAISRAGARADGGQGRTRASSRATGTPSRLASTPRMTSSMSAEPSDGAAAAEGESGGSAQVTASGGTQVFSVRSMALKKAGTHFRAFFSDPANVDANRDEDGHYLVPRSTKHFGAFLEYIRDGSCELPTAYTPTTYDNRPASTECDELLEFAREAAFYGLKPLLEQASSRMLTLTYGENKAMLQLLRSKGLVR